MGVAARVIADVARDSSSGGTVALVIVIIVVALALVALGVWRMRRGRRAAPTIDSSAATTDVGEPGSPPA
jgi:hypothetical protein